MHVHARVDRHTLSPEQNVAVCQRDPELVLCQTQQDRIVKNAALGSSDQNVFTLTYRHFREVTRGEHLDEFSCIRASDLNLALYRHITQNGVVYQIPEVLLWATEVTWNVHVVVDREACRTPTHSGVEVR